MNTLVSILYTGVVLSSIFAISSVGLALIYGALRFLNLAHGAFFVVGGYAAWAAAAWLGWPLEGGIVVAALVGALLGLVMYALILKPLIGSDRWATATIIASVGLAIVIEAGVLAGFGPRMKTLPPAIEGGLAVGTTVITYNAVAIGLAAVLLLLAINVVLQRSRAGIALRAVAENLDAACLMGISADRTFAIAVAMSCALAAMSGVLLGGFMVLRPDSGLDPMLTAIAVVVFGGLGSIKGTIVAAFIIGFLQAAVSVLLGAKWGLPAVFLFMIVMLVVRPHGLYGTPSEARI